MKRLKKIKIYASDAHTQSVLQMGAIYSDVTTTMTFKVYKHGPFLSITMYCKRILIR